MKFRYLLAAMLLPLALLGAACSDDEQGSDAASTEAGSNDAAAVEGASNAAVTETTAPADPKAPLTMGTPPGPDTDTATLNIAQIAAGTSAVTQLTQMVVKSGLLPTLRDGGPFTVFAPVNEAFDALPPETLRAVVEDNGALTDVLELHVVAGTYKSTDLMDLDGQTLTTVQGGKLLVQMDGDDILVGGAKVVAPDIMASNGVIHAVGSVIAEPNG